MEKFLIPSSPPQNPKPASRPPWNRIASELDGRVSSKIRHQDSQLLLNSYSEVRTFRHCDNNGTENCPTYIGRMGNEGAAHSFLREGISGLEFDSKGIYLAAVTKSGCLTVHDFETLYCTIYGPSSSLMQDETKPLLHISMPQTFDAVRWNPTNQDESIDSRACMVELSLATEPFLIITCLDPGSAVACTSRKNNKVLIYDIGYVSSEPVEVLEKGMSKFSRLNGGVHNGLSDIAFASSDKSRLLASGLDGAIYAWDRRQSNLPCVELNSTSQGQLNSIQFDMEDRVVFGASNQGIIYAWDLRGGRASSVAFQRPNEAYYPPLASLKISAMLEKITSLKVQTIIKSREIHSISINPSCPYQLAFHLDDGWSGVLDVSTLSITHMHCPPAWLDGMDMSSGPSTLRRPAWLPTCSIFAVGSSSGEGIYLLDFFPNRSSACYVDYDVELQSPLEESKGAAQNKYLNVSEKVLVCAAHPLNGTIIAGSKQSSLLVISERHPSGLQGI